MAIHTLADDIVVIEVCGQPCVARMAVVASIATRNMVSRLTFDDDIVVTIRTSTENLRVINSANRRECRRGVAVLTEVCSSYVRDVLARCTNTIVTTRTVCVNPEVIEKHRKPSSRSMARITLLLRRRMIRWLTDCLYVVVTCRTTAKYGVMVHLLERKPGICAMAVLTEVSA